MLNKAYTWGYLGVRCTGDNWREDDLATENLGHPPISGDARANGIQALILRTKSQAAILDPGFLNPLHKVPKAESNAQSKYVPSTTRSTFFLRKTESRYLLKYKI